MCRMAERAGVSPARGNMSFFLQMFLYNYIGQNGITSSIGEEVV